MTISIAAPTVTVEGSKIRAISKITANEDVTFTVWATKVMLTSSTDTSTAKNIGRHDGTAFVKSTTSSMTGSVSTIIGQFNDLSADLTPGTYKVWTTTRLNGAASFTSGPQVQVTIAGTPVTEPEPVPSVSNVKVTTATTTASLSWTLNNTTTATAGRDGVDKNGYGAWTSEPLTVNTQWFTDLVPNTSYTFTVTPTGGAAVSVVGKTLAESSTTPTPDPTPVPGTNPLAFKSMTSGMGVQDAANGKANEWIGRRVMGLYSHWGGDGKLWGIDVPTAEYGINSVSRLGDYDLDCAPQRQISTWANAANGGDDAKWTADITEMKNRWGNRQGKLYYRPWHEFNGDWFNWSVRSAADQVNFVKAWQRLANIFHSIVGSDTRFVLVWSPNRDSKYGLDVKKCWPGDDYVDVIGIDYYDYALGANGTDAQWNTEYNRVDSAGSPVGIGAWIKFATDHGKPWTLPEWGEQFGDNLIFLQKMAAVFEANRYTGTGSPAGKCLGMSWHNLYAPGGTPDPNATSGNFLIQVNGQDYSGRPKASAFWRQWQQNATWLRTV